MNAIPVGEACPPTLQNLRRLRSRRRNAESGVQNHVVKSARRLRFAAGIVMALPIAVLVAGCQERLAQRDAYFAPLSGLSVSLHSETERMVNYHRALQAARHGCLEPHRLGASPDVEGSGSMRAEGAEGDGAHARLLRVFGAHARRAWRAPERLPALGGRQGPPAARAVRDGLFDRERLLMPAPGTPDPLRTIGATMALSPDSPYARAFAADGGTLQALRAGLAGRKAKVQRGRLAAALRSLAGEPASRVLFVDLDGVSEPCRAARELASVCAFETAVIAIGSTDTAQ